MNRGTVYIISDGTGETASMMARAALVHFRDEDITIVRCKNVRTVDQIESILDEVFQKSGIILHTVASSSMRTKIKEICSAKAIPVIDLLGPLVEAFQTYFGHKDEVSLSSNILRAVDERYYKRIEAIEYTVKHDDGKTVRDLNSADIVLVGISRTSKTPLSIFLSHKGWKVANVPLVPGTPLPEELFSIDQRKVVGLTIDAESLSRIRRKRLEKFGQDPGSEYATMGQIHKEIDFALEIFKGNRRWPVFDVTDRALEETAAEIIRVVATRMNLPFEALL